MRRLLWVLAWSILAADAFGGPVAPPNFRALPGVGGFANNEVGRWDSVARKFHGGPMVAATTPIATTTPYQGAAIDFYSGMLATPATYSGGHLAQFYSRMVAPSDAPAESIRGDAYRGTGNPFLTGVRGGAIYDGSGSPANMLAVYGDTELMGGSAPGGIKCLAGTLGVQGSASANFAAGCSLILFTAGVGTPAITDGYVIYANANLPVGHISSVRGIGIKDWAGGATIDNSDAILIDSSVDRGTTTRHCINSGSTSASLFAGDVAFTNSAKGPVMLDSVTGHFVRLTLAGGVITQTDLGTNVP